MNSLTVVTAPSESPEQVIARLNKVIDERKPNDYSEMIENMADVFYLTEAERAEIHNARMALPTHGSLAEAAKERIKERIALRKSKKSVSA